MGPDDQFLGWVNLGRVPAGRPKNARPVVDLDEIVRVVGDDGRTRAYVGR
jgi:hypothetical protein